MIRRLVGLALRRQALVIVVAVGVVAFGLFQLDETEVDTLPEFLPPIVEVQTEALGLSADEVEQLITVPLEADLLNGVAWLESIRSESLPGLSSIVMTFEPGTDVLRARQVVQERLTQAAGLPNVSRAPAMVQPLSAESRVMMIGLSSDDVSLIDMSVLARWTVRPFLMGVEGVANVSVWGQRERQLQVLVDQDVLARADVPLLDVVKTTGNALWVSPLSFLEASTPGVGGFIDGPNQRIGVQHVLGIETPDDLAAVVVEGRGDLTLGEITQVVEDHQPLIGDAVVDDGPGLLLVVEKFPWSNTVATTRAVEAALDELAPGLAGITVDTDLFRPADYVDRSIDSTQLASVVAGALVVVVLLLLIGWRAAAVAAASLLVSLIGTGLVLFVTDTEVNVMVFAGIVVAFGLLVADAVGDIGSLQRRISGTDPGARRAVIVDAAAEVRRPVLFAVVALIVAMTPVVVMEGAAGEFLPSVAVTAIVALVVSVIVSTTVTPALSALVLGRTGGDHGETPTMAALRRALGAARGVGMVPAAVAAAVMLVVGAGVIPTLDRDYIPEFEQTDLLIRLDGVAGTSLQESRRIATAAAEEIRELDGVDDVGAHVGRAVLSDETVNVNSAELWVKIDPDADYEATVAAIQEIVSGFPGFSAPGAVTYSNERINEVLRTPNPDLVVRVYGEDPVVLGETAERVATLVDDVEGTSNVRAVHPVLEPAIEIEVDLARAADFEVKPGDVRRTAATLLSGIEVGSFFEQQKVFEVVVWSPPSERQSLTSVEQLLIDAPSGELVELSEVADVRVAPVSNVIRRDAVSRYIDVVAEVSGRDHGALEDDIQAAVAAQGLPFEYHVRVLDDAAEAAGDRRQFVAVAVAAAVAIILVVQAAFASWRLAAMVAIITPLALSGGLVALAISGGTYSIGSSLGLFAVFGLTLHQGLSLLGRSDALQLEEGRPFGPDVVATAVQDRFAPTFATFAAVAAAMLGVVVLGERAGLEVIRPLAVVVLGGSVTALVVALIVLPAAVVRFGRPATPRESFAPGEA